MCMAPHIGKMVEAGVHSFKIEGRAKSHYYTAVTANAYRGAMDAYLENPSASVPQWVMDELEKISHRPYSTGFYFGRPDNAQTYLSAGYLRDYSVAGVVKGYENGKVVLELKNKFSKGQELDCLQPKCQPFTFIAEEMFDGNDNAIDSAPHPMMTVKIPFECEVKTGSLLRMKTE